MSVHWCNYTIPYGVIIYKLTDLANLGLQKNLLIFLSGLFSGVNYVQNQNFKHPYLCIQQRADGFFSVQFKEKYLKYQS